MIIARPHDTLMMREGYASVLRTPVNTTLLFNAIHAVVSHGMPANVVSLANRFLAHPVKTPACASWWRKTTRSISG